MATDESKDTPSEEKAPASAEPAPAPSTDAARSEAAEPVAAEEQGWPRSWIIVTAVLGIIAIIVVARLAGRSWKGEEPIPGEPSAKVPERPERPDQPPTGPAAGGTEKVLLELKDLAVNTGRFCLGKDGKAHPIDKTPDAPAPCKISTAGVRSYRVEVVRGAASQEVAIRAAALLGKEAPMVVQAMMIPGAREEMTFFASNIAVGAEMALIVDGLPNGKLMLSRVRLIGQ